jgi:hypothetical protein
VAYAGAYTWDGDTSSDWQTATNWAEAGYPGKDAAGDTATIADGSTNSTVTVSGAVPNSVAWVLVDADAAGVSMELEIQSGGSLTTTDLVTIKGDQDGTATATLTVSTCDTFKPDSLYFWGRNHATDGHAIGNFDDCMEVQGAEDNSWDVWVRGYVEWNIGSGDEVHMKDMEMDGTNGANLTITGTSSTLCTYTYKGNSQPISVSGVTWTNGISCSCSCPP